MTSASDRPGGRAAPGAEVNRAALAFAAENRFVLAAQIAALCGISLPSARRRLGALAARGLLAGEEVFAREPKAFGITPAGLREIGSDLPAPRGVDPALYAHDAGLAWLALAARRGAFGPLTEIVSERRMRSQDGRGGEALARHGLELLDADAPSGRGGRHYPDLVATTASGHRVAFELELTTKDAARRERILAAYAACGRIDAVVYLVGSEAAQRALERSARAVGAADLVHVQRYTWPGGRAPGRRGPTRTRPSPTRGNRGSPRPPGRSAEGR